MALAGKDIMAWAKGGKADAMKPTDLGAEDEEPDLGLEEEMEEGERNQVWAGELPVDEATPPEVVEEFMGWLEENEPEIYEAVMALATAVASEDQAMIEAGLEGLMAATQYLNPEYPPLPEEKRAEAGQAIAKHMRDKGHPKEGSPEWKQAVAIGLSEARQGEAP